jgi:hypothetical protein
MCATSVLVAERQRVSEDAHREFEADSVFVEIGGGFRRTPLKPDTHTKLYIQKRNLARRLLRGNHGVAGYG